MAFEAKKYFPLLAANPRWTYMDSAASTQKPAAVIERERSFYLAEYANVHRGIYELAQRAARADEAARANVADFIGAASAREVIFTAGTTIWLNMLAAMLARRISRNDTVLVAADAHHSNLIPWQTAAAEKEARLRIIELTPEG